MIKKNVKRFFHDSPERTNQLAGGAMGRKKSEKQDSITCKVKEYRLKKK